MATRCLCLREMKWWPHHLTVISCMQCLRYLWKCGSLYKVATNHWDCYMSFKKVVFPKCSSSKPVLDKTKFRTKKRRGKIQGSFMSRECVKNSTSLKIKSNTKINDKLSISNIETFWRLNIPNTNIVESTSNHDTNSRLANTIICICLPFLYIFFPHKCFSGASQIVIVLSLSWKKV